MGGSHDSAASDVNDSFGEERPVILTDSAVKAALDAIAAEGNPGDGLRVSIVGGGCSGYQYNLDFENEDRTGDTVMQFEGLRVFLDWVSGEYMRGTVIDYVTGDNGSGFRFNNPNARRMCSCSHSR